MFQLGENGYTYTAYAALLVLLAFLTFGSLSTHLFDTDDYGYWHIMSVTLEDWTYFFSPSRDLAVRPPSDLFFLISYSLWDYDPGPPHVLQVVFHLACSLLLAYTFRQFGIHLELSLLAALLFFMNVAHFRAVQWITCMNYTVGMIFVLCTLIAFVRFLKSRRQFWLFGTAGLLAIAIFTHPGTFAVTLFLTYLTWRKHGSVRQTVAVLWPLLVVALVCVVTAYAISTQSSQVQGLSGLPHPLNVIKYLLWYIGRLITNAHWLTASLSDTPSLWELGVGLLVCISILVLYLRRIFPAADWAIWSFFTILPFTYFPHVLLAGPSRHLYLPSIGSSFILAWFIYTLSGRIASYFGKQWGKLTLGLLLLGILGSSFFTLKRCEAMALYTSGRNYIAMKKIELGIQQFKRAIAIDPYLTPPDTYARTALALFGVGKSPQDILETSLTIYPNAPILNLYLGICYAGQRDPVLQAQGEKRIQKAFAISEEKDLFHLDAATAYYNLATYHYNSKNYRKAMVLYQKSLSFRPDSPNTMFFVGKTLYAQNLEHEALQMFQRVIQISPEHVGARYALGVLLNAQGKIDEAIHEYRKVLQIDPNNGDVYVHLAGALYSQGKIDEALPYYRQAITFKPENPHLYRDLAIVLIEKGELNTAIDVLKVAAGLEPNHVLTWHTLGIVYNVQGHYRDALSAFQQTVRLSPDDWEAHLSLAQAYERLDKIEEAIEKYRHTLSLNPDNHEVRNSLQALLQYKASK